MNTEEFLKKFKEDATLRERVMSAYSAWQGEHVSVSTRVVPGEKMLGGLLNVIADMNTTNDPKDLQQREPLLSDQVLFAFVPVDDEYGHAERAMEKVRAFYEEKIIKGELRVVETATVVQRQNGTMCSRCSFPFEWESEPQPGQYCLNCSSKIIEG